MIRTSRKHVLSCMHSLSVGGFNKLKVEPVIKELSYIYVHILHMFNTFIVREIVEWASNDNVRHKTVLV